MDVPEIYFMTTYLQGASPNHGQVPQKRQEVMEGGMSQAWESGESCSLTDCSRSASLFKQNSVGRDRLMLFQNIDHIGFIPGHMFNVLLVICLLTLGKE